MKKSAYWITGALVVALGTAGIASAHGDGQRGGGIDMLFERFDTDGDGKITAAEIEAMAAERFAAADADKDGFLTMDEISAHAKAKRQEARAERRAGRMQKMFDHMDADEDGKLSMDEAAARSPVERLLRLDADEDGAISREEVETARADRGGRWGKGKDRGHHGEGRHGGGERGPWWLLDN